MFTVLHPNLHSEWFKMTIPVYHTAGNPTKKARVEAAQRDTVEKAELLFTHVAHAYYNNKPASNTTSKGTEAKKASHIPEPIDCLADICDFEVETAPMVESENQLQDELRWYFKFEGGCTSLAALLAWWKVSWPISIHDLASDQ